MISPVMVGRGEQLSALAEIFDRVCAGTPAVVLLVVSQPNWAACFRSWAALSHRDPVLIGP